ncbi:MAG: bacteriohopanetetrol glucosamine biosynthesis glycosyltransferase HpnI [Anaerolineae bacterium]|nr:bacteriohopanetetrol glucosamine biosynthesis glycosyltransferase HpnI [Anaerolineae bacterium]
MLCPLVLLILTIMSWVYWLVACWCAATFFAEPQPAADEHLPPVSLLKPMRGLDAGAYENLRSHLTQDYPAYEVLVGVTDGRDPALEVVRELQREFGGRRIRAFVAPKVGANDKVSSLCYLAQQASYDTLVVCDSDMRVTGDFLARMTAPLHDPSVGLVTCLYRGAQAETFTAVLEALYIGATFLPSVLVARRYLRMRFALGAAVALRRQQLQEIGGFEVLADYLADDYQLGARVAATGKRVHLCDYTTQTILGATTFRQQWDREVRWAKCTRVSRPLEYPGLLLTFSTPLALLTAASLGFSTAGCGAVVVSLLVRWLVARQMAGHLGDRLILASWLWLPVRDLLTAAVWCAAGLGRRVNWRDGRYVLCEGGRLRELAPREAHAPAP